MMKLDQALVSFRRRYFLEAIKLCGGNCDAAAEVLGVHRNTVGREMKRAGIDSVKILKLCRIEKRVHRLNPGPGKKPPARETAESIERMFELQRRRA